MTDGPDAAAVQRPALATGRAPAKLILLGEHFVVHGQPALALPLPLFATRVDVLVDPTLQRLALDAPQAPPDSTAPRVLARAVELLELAPERPWRLVVRSTIPIGHGLGSSAALAVALLRALTAAAGRAQDVASLNGHAHELERITHGRPSGIDNTVITQDLPLRFCCGAGKALSMPAGLRFVLASSGTAGATAEAVARVGALRQRDPSGFSRLCQVARRVVEDGTQAFRAADAAALGACMSENHALLQQLGVSTPALDQLAAAARAAGAHGAKLTGAGRGGFVVALVPAEAEAAVERALRDGGAAQTFSWQPAAGAAPQGAPTP